MQVVLGDDVRVLAVVEQEPGAEQGPGVERELVVVVLDVELVLGAVRAPVVAAAYAELVVVVGTVVVVVAMNINGNRYSNY